MYFLKFIKWFWNKHLEDDTDKFGFVMICWGIFGTTMLALTGLFHTGFFIGCFIVATIASLVLLAIISGFVYMRNRYNEWQSEVFKKLKE